MTDISDSNTKQRGAIIVTVITGIGIGRYGPIFPISNNSDIRTDIRYIYISVADLKVLSKSDLDFKGCVEI